MTKALNLAAASALTLTTPSSRSMPAMPNMVTMARRRAIGTRVMQWRPHLRPAPSRARPSLVGGRPLGLPGWDQVVVSDLHRCDLGPSA